MACFGDCYDLGPPPNMILSMPPPPLPTFLLPRSAIVALSGNDSQPCFTAYMCESSLSPRDKTGIEYIELSRKGQIGSEDTWLFVLISSCVGVLLFGALLAMVLVKCRDSYNYSYQETSSKQPQISTTTHLAPSSNKSNAFMNSTVLYPCGPPPNRGNENRVLWAALTPNGTQHFLSDSKHNDHYEVMDYGTKHSQKCSYGPINAVKSSFENSGYIDYDYEDPIQIDDAYHLDDMDSGYQEPLQEPIGTLPRNSSPRPTVSSPTHIENPNIAPLNQYPHRNYNNNGTLLLINNKKTILSRGISEVPYYGTQNM